jgi:hypothetical protein
MAPEPPNGPVDRPSTPDPSATDPRFAALLAEVAGRLHASCATMPPDAFQALVANIARLKLRWSGEHPLYYPAVTPDQERSADPPRAPSP